MPKINLLNIETRGVDMRTNPLLLDKKLHAGTNLVFEEGVIKTRPGFRYKTLGCSGQFQGSGEFRPRRGLSAAPLSESKSGLVVVVGGEIWMNCKKIGDAFEGQGDVNIFQAENYLILQNNNSSTFWWNGETLTESPGMQETDWEEVETPVQEVEIVAPVAVIPECSFENSQGGITTTFIVRHLKTGRSIPGALVTLFKGTNRVAKGRTKDDGTLVLGTALGTYSYTVNLAGYVPAGANFESTGTAIPHKWDACVDATLVVTGNNLVDVRLDEIVIPDNPDGDCFAVSASIINQGLNNLKGRVRITNNSILPKVVNTITLPAGATHNASLPATVAAGKTLIVNIFSAVTLRYTSVTVNTDCNDGNWVFVDDNPFVGLNIVLRYAPGQPGSCNYGHNCNAAIFKVRANGVLLGTVNLNNAPDGYAKSGSFDISDTQAEILSQNSSDGKTVRFSFECATDHPEFDSVVFNGECHNNLGNLVIKSVAGTELYNGCPGSNQIDINVSPLP